MKEFLQLKNKEASNVIKKIKQNYLTMHLTKEKKQMLNKHKERCSAASAENNTQPWMTKVTSWLRQSYVLAWKQCNWNLIHHAQADLQKQAILEKWLGSFFWSKALGDFVAKYLLKETETIAPHGERCV